MVSEQLFLIVVIIMLAIIAGLFALIFWRERQHDRERRELYSRLMARDLSDFTAAVNSETSAPVGGNFVKRGILNSVNQRQSLERILAQAGGE